MGAEVVAHPQGKCCGLKLEAAWRAQKGTLSCGGLHMHEPFHATAGMISNRMVALPSLCRMLRSGQVSKGGF